MNKTVKLLLAAPLFLWLLLILHLLRLSTAFNFLVKHLTPSVVFGVMTLCPLGAAFLGMRMRRENAFVARLAVFGGAFLFLAFVIYPGIPWVRKKLEPKTPKNPSHPTLLPPLAGLPVFPGAEGFGTRTPAGRGGKVIEVSSLADDGPATLRAALKDPAPRTIVFRVSGTIELHGPIIVTQPFLTIAGQTAPGDGICIKNAGLIIATHDVLVQHLRVRPGNEGKVEPDNNDAITILGKHGKIADGAFNVVLDHVSASWSEDETISTWFAAHDITISWCIVSEGLHKSRHHKGGHSTGLLIGDSSDHVSVHHTLLAHNHSRNPLIGQGGTHDVVNNVIYNWAAIPAEVYDEDSNSFVNFVGNFFRAGPSEKERGTFEIIVNSKGVPKLYVEGNRGPHRAGDQADDWSLVSYKWNQQVAPVQYRSQQRFETWPVTASSANEAFAAVLQRAGATQPKRDAVDARVVAEVEKGTGAVIDSPSQVGGYPRLANATAPVDSDHDGIPDDWERARGLEPQNPADGNGYADQDGYTNLEKYLHSLTR